MVLGFFSSLLFTGAFLALFALLVLANLFGEIDNLQNTLSDNLPNIILNSVAIKARMSEMVETSLFQGDEQAVQAQLELMKMACTGSSPIEDDLRSLCPDLLSGKINNKEDVKNALIEELGKRLKDEISTGLKKVFSELKTSLASIDQFKVWIVIIFVVLLFVGALFVYFDSFNLSKAMNTVLWRIAISSLLYTISFLFFSILASLGVVENMLVAGLEKNMKIEDPQAFIDQETMKELLSPLVNIIINWISGFMFKIAVVFAIIFIVGLVAWYFTRVKNQK